MHTINNEYPGVYLGSISEQKAETDGVNSGGRGAAVLHFLYPIRLK